MAKRPRRRPAGKPAEADPTAAGANPTAGPSDGQPIAAGPPGERLAEGVYEGLVVRFVEAVAARAEAELARRRNRQADPQPPPAGSGGHSGR